VVDFEVSSHRAHKPHRRIWHSYLHKIPGALHFCLLCHKLASFHVLYILPTVPPLTCSVNTPSQALAGTRTLGANFLQNLRIPLARPRMRAVERGPCSVQKFRHNIGCVHYITSPILKPIFDLNPSFLRNIRVLCRYSSYSPPFLY
jgi:hypothetical protein